MTTKKNVLVLGSGGREHALCVAISKSSQIDTLYAAPGSDAISSVAVCLALKDDDSSYVNDVVNLVKKYNIDLVVVGPEKPLTLGVTDRLRQEGIDVFGPSQKASLLESSKVFMKDLCKKYHIPTAGYEVFSQVNDALDYIKKASFPLVVKADGLAAGKGVVIAFSQKEAEEALQNMMVDHVFGDSGKTIVIEEFLEGVELSYFALCDGKNVVPFGSAQDHKSLYEGGEGPNTGGMGAYSPVAFCDDIMEKEIQDKILMPLVNAMQEEGRPYTGVLFLGLMVTKNGIQLLECNVRFGDPECQVLMSRLSHDMLDIVSSAACGKLNEIPSNVMGDNAALTVVVSAKGYPFSYEKNVLIPDLSSKDVMVFHAGTYKKEDHYYSKGGRVLNITAVASTIHKARDSAYAFLRDKKFKETFYYREDIGGQS